MTEAIGFIAGQQQPDGSFIGQSSPSVRPFVPVASYASPFVTALILNCLADADAPEVKRRGAEFLRYQLGPDATANYWARNSPESHSRPYPDDLDDTFCLAAAVQLAAPDLMDGETLARLIRTLTAQETGTGGPYRTWLVDEGAPARWQDVDLAVNANVARFLRLQDVSLPNLNGFFERAISENAYVSPYYPGPAAIRYFLARAYDGPGSVALRRHILADLPSHAGSPLSTAMEVSSALRVGASRSSVRSQVAYLASVLEKGAWEPEGFCVDPAREGTAHYGGSAALTAAMCVEALVLARPKPRAMKDTSQPIPHAVQDRLSMFNNINIERIIGPNNLREILTLPRLAARFAGVAAPDDDSLACATIYGWLAYMIYDTFLDEGGDPRLLPVANLAQREMNGIFMATEPNTGFPGLARTVLDRVDAANAWETASCRCDPAAAMGDLALPDYGSLMPLADRSLGHALPVLATLARAGFATDSPETEATLAFFEHYLIARQLNDDAHDWQDDLDHGQVNPVAVRLIAAVRGKLPTATPLCDPALRERMADLFWKKEIVEVCKLIIQHGEAARACLSGLTSVNGPTLERLLASPVGAAELALKEHAKAAGFVAAYGKKT